MLLSVDFSPVLEFALSLEILSQCLKLISSPGAVGRDEFSLLLCRGFLYGFLSCWQLFSCGWWWARHVSDCCSLYSAKFFSSWDLHTWLLPSMPLCVCFRCSHRYIPFLKEKVLVPSWMLRGLIFFELSESRGLCHRTYSDLQSLLLLTACCIDMDAFHRTLDHFSNLSFALLDGEVESNYHPQ